MITNEPIFVAKKGTSLTAANKAAANNIVPFARKASPKDLIVMNGVVRNPCDAASAAQRQNQSLENPIV